MLNEILSRKKSIIILMGTGCLILLSLLYIGGLGVKPSNGIDPKQINSRTITAIGIKDPITFKPKILKDKEYIDAFILTLYQLKEVEKTIEEKHLKGDVKKIVLHREPSLINGGGDYTMYLFSDFGIILYMDKQYFVSDKFKEVLNIVENNASEGWW